MNLLRTQYEFLYTKKIHLITLVVVFINLIILTLQSSILTLPDDFTIHQQYYINEFQQNGFTIIKMIVLLYSMFVSIYALYISKYDVFLVGRYSKELIFSTKLSVIVFINTVLLVVLSMMYFCLLLLLGMKICVNIILLILLKSLLFMVFYTVLTSLLLVIFNNMFVSLVPLLGYFVSNLSIDYGVELSKLSTSSKILNLFFPDLIVISSSYDYVYGGVIVLCFIIIYLSLFLYISLQKDIYL